MKWLNKRIKWRWDVLMRQAQEESKVKTVFRDDAERDLWMAMVDEMREPDRPACGCGYPEQACLRVVLRNGPPYPPRPCEPSKRTRPAIGDES